MKCPFIEGRKPRFSSRRQLAIQDVKPGTRELEGTPQRSKGYRVKKGSSHVYDASSWTVYSRPEFVLVRAALGSELDGLWKPQTHATRYISPLTLQAVPEFPETSFSISAV